jgi:hypothetical protein
VAENAVDVDVSNCQSQILVSIHSNQFPELHGGQVPDLGGSHYSDIHGSHYPDHHGNQTPKHHGNHVAELVHGSVTGAEGGVCFMNGGSPVFASNAKQRAKGDIRWCSPLNNMKAKLASYVYPIPVTARLERNYDDSNETSGCESEEDVSMPHLELVPQYVHASFRNGV